jgi:farnesyl diphosphate synthase
MRNESRVIFAVLFLSSTKDSFVVDLFVVCFALLCFAWIDCTWTAIFIMNSAAEKEEAMNNALTSTMILAVSLAAVAGTRLDFGNYYAALMDLSSSERQAMGALIFALIVFIVTAVQLTASMTKSDPAKATANQKKSKEDATTRTLTTTKNNNKTYPLAELAAASSDKDKFMVLFPYLKQEILTYLTNEHELLAEAVIYLDRMMEYSVPGGKLNRGTTVIAVCRSLNGGDNLNDTVTAQAAVLGWCIEFLQAFFLVADDVMDSSQTRRGAPCWYKLPDVGLVAINDSFLLESFVFLVLKLHFGDHPAYGPLLDLFLSVTQKTEVGQLYDLTSQPQNGKVDLDRFTMTRYSQIVKYKTAFYSFYLPVALGMRLAGLPDEKGVYDVARDICVEMGEYFQIQDDYLDCFGDPKEIGKVGTDIQENKCSWLIVQALQLCANDKNKMNVLKSNYGQWNDGKVEKVKKLYKELDLPQVYQTYEENFYASITAKLASVDAMPKEVFELFLHKIYKRSK